MVDPGRQLHHVDRQLDVHVAFDAPPAVGVGVLARGLGDERVAVVGQRRVFLRVQDRRIVVRADQVPLLAERVEKRTVVDVEAQVAGSGIKVRAVDEERNPFAGKKLHAMSHAVDGGGAA